MSDFKRFIDILPKAELHLHIEGTLEAELMFEIARRNNIVLKYDNVDALRLAYDFNNLQEFLDLYYDGARVLQKEIDFYQLTYAYLQKISAQNVRHTEIFFDPQTHTNRDVKFSTVVDGIHKAMVDGRKNLGVSSGLILSFLRHLDEKSAMDTMDSAMEYRDRIVGIGLDSSEKGNPPSKFERVFKKARDLGFYTVAHAGEEGPAEYVWEAIDILKVNRVDHGNNALDDPDLIKTLKDRKIPLTLCPLSNLKLKVIKNVSDHPVAKMLRDGLLVTINSDDPAYFGGYINENYLQTAKAVKLTRKEIGQIAQNSFTASFIDKKDKAKFIKELDKYLNSVLPKSV